MTIRVERAPYSETPLLSCGLYLPTGRLTNDILASWNIATNGGRVLTAQDFFDKLGVIERPQADADETVLSMGVAAAEPLVRRTGGKIDAVFFTTSYPTEEHNASYLVEHVYGLDPDIALDVYAACSGFTQVLSHLHQYREAFAGARVLIVSSEKYSPTLVDLKNPQGAQQDPSLSQAIFGDGAVAVSFIVGKDGLLPLASLNYHFPEPQSQAIEMPFDDDQVVEPAMVVPVPPSLTGKFRMNGRAVIKSAAEIARLMEKTIEAAKLPPDGIDIIIPHQASGPMLESLTHHLPPNLAEKLYYDLEQGNLSSASIPKALIRAVKEGRIRNGDTILFVGFGAGMYASASVYQYGKT